MNVSVPEAATSRFGTFRVEGQRSPCVYRDLRRQLYPVIARNEVTKQSPPLPAIEGGRLLLRLVWVWSRTAVEQAVLDIWSGPAPALSAGAA